MLGFAFQLFWLWVLAGIAALLIVGAVTTLVLVAARIKPDWLWRQTDGLSLRCVDHDLSAIYRRPVLAADDMMIKRIVGIGWRDRFLIGCIVFKDEVPQPIELPEETSNGEDQCRTIATTT